MGTNTVEERLGVLAWTVWKAFRRQTSGDAPRNEPSRVGQTGDGRRRRENPSYPRAARR